MQNYGVLSEYIKFIKCVCVIYLVNHDLLDSLLDILYFLTLVLTNNKHLVKIKHNLLLKMLSNIGEH